MDPRDPKLFSSLTPDGVREGYRDREVWVLEKPEGVLSHPNPPARKAPNALVDGVYNFKDECYQLSIAGEQRRIYLIHRLDQETSGLILCAFDADCAARLKEDLRTAAMRKEYRALVFGRVGRQRGMWSDRLCKQSGGGQATVRARRGEPNARTTYEVVESVARSGVAHLKLEPETGRTHQLRVQAAARDLPIVGDARYGDFTANRFCGRQLKLGRMFLHAVRLIFSHPRTARRVDVRCPLPREFEAALESFRALPHPVPRRT